MATNSSLKNKLANRETKETKIVSAGTLPLKDLLNTPTMKKRFEELLKSRAPQFMTSILNLYNSEPALHQCEPMSIISSALVAASLDLPVDKNLGYAWIVPYNDNKSKTKKAQFQLGYKGYIQLALRTGQYRAINAIPIHEGELKKWNPLTEEIEIDFEARKSDVVTGYAGFFELINGFRKTVYWTKEQIELHRRRFSKSSFGWDNDYDAMALKTVIKNMLSKWGILSIEMQQAVIAEEEERERVDITPSEENEVIDAEFSEVIQETSESEEDPFEGSSENGENQRE
ncbi:recombinase RecT [Geobacillus stearothermophilus]|uniref:recombinase RecT n=1 Tax=Geobacillus stearothermophilus TaxID=1422 RepID=UPI000518787F|nr:recombinase RecT [Geobacillus stearothermophilus]MED4333350.1 recombinase RecT [Geobacillus stearothermophilus]MED4995857.1 recombinase RecT [Geobacillus stearothermophilus]